jgi:lipopolysaccharide transport system ATP-binding protein
MSEDVVIRAEGLGKKYIIGHQSAERSSTLRDAIVRSARNWGRSFRDLTRGAASIAGDETEEFWALKDVSFEIKRGDVVGVIGRNGAGKSTLLKVLSRITEPSEGRVEIKGRIASLLEVGTGFHPELSGRENIYLNGAILGMGQAEIKRKFDEIVDFAEIEKFLDTPVKRYSSGMYVRLAFAVAAHLEPEILIVDEVLAVGDAEFQKKCLGKMQDVAGHGRTVIFVSHNLAAVRQLCSRGLLLAQGALLYADTTNAVADRYLNMMLPQKQRSVESSESEFFDVCVRDSQGKVTSAIYAGTDAILDFGIFVKSAFNPQAGFTLYAENDTPILLSASEHGNAQLQVGSNRFSVKVPTRMLSPGLYRIEGAIWAKDEVLFQSECLAQLQIIPGQVRELQGRTSNAHFVSREEWTRSQAPSC